MPILNLTSANEQQIKPSKPVAARYNGFSLRETSGTAPALVRIFDGMDASGVVLDEVALAPGESAREFYRDGFPALRGIFVQVATGSVAGSVRYS